MINNIKFPQTHYLAIIHRFGSDPIVLCEEMVSCSITRDLQNPVQAFSLTIKPFDDYFFGDSRIEAGDWIEILVTGPSVKDLGPDVEDMLQGLNPIEATQALNERSISYSIFSYPIDVILKDTQQKISITGTRRRFLGIIERVGRSDTIKDGTPIKTVDITGKSWAKSLLESQVLLLPWFESSNRMAQRAKDLQIEETPEKNIRKLLDIYFGLDQYIIPDSLQERLVLSNNIRTEGAYVSNIPAVSIGDKKTIYDFVFFKFSECDGKIVDTPMITAKGSLWQLLENFREATLNELWTDIDEFGMPIIVLREYPYSDSYTIPLNVRDKFRQYFDKLKECRIHYDDWTSLKTGFSDQERANFFVAISESHPLGSVMEQMGTLYSETVDVNSDSINKYGLKMREEKILYSPYPERNSGELWAQTIKKFTTLIKHWYENNHNLLNGVCVCVDKFDITLGCRLVISGIRDYNRADTKDGFQVQTINIEEEYYVVGIDETWEAFQMANFTIKLCRGRRYSTDGYVKGISKISDSRLGVVS